MLQGSDGLLCVMFGRGANDDAVDACLQSLLIVVIDDCAAKLRAERFGAFATSANKVELGLFAQMLGVDSGDGTAADDADFLLRCHCLGSVL